MEYTTLLGVREYDAEWPVTIKKHYRNGRECVCAKSDAGHNGTSVDLLELIKWIKENRPELLKEGAECHD